MNMQQLMQQAQRMQREITKKKEEIDNETFEGKSEWVNITFNGKREILSFKITNSQFLRWSCVGACKPAFIIRSKTSSETGISLKSRTILLE